MISPSNFFTASVELCGEPGAEFVREMQGWKRPALVSHPTIRRIDWKGAAERWPGQAPTLPFEGNDDLERFSNEVFVWARSAWRGFLAPQLAAIVPWRGTSYDARECHPFTLGYVRGAIWELVEHASPGESWSLPAFIAIGATADVYGLEWVDDLEDVIDDLKGCGLPPDSSLAFQEGARRSIEDMEYYLAGTDLEPRQLVEWFESRESASSDVGDSRSSGSFDMGALRAAIAASGSPNEIFSGESE